jgi:dihydroneopterin aldolase
MVDAKDRRLLRNARGQIMNRRGRMLASVRSMTEAQIALEEGADIIDLKEPSRGALGVLDHDVVSEIVRFVAGRVPVSATIGDLVAMEPDEIVSAVERMAQMKVDIVKVGFFPAASATACIDALRAHAHRGLRIVAVLFADHAPDWSWLRQFAKQEFHGVMLDTIGKDGRSLRDYANEGQLGDFVNKAHELGLIAGLAGSLRREDIAALMPLCPDYLGFRGALCDGRSRAGSISRTAIRNVRAAIVQC